MECKKWVLISTADLKMLGAFYTPKCAMSTKNMFPFFFGSNTGKGSCPISINYGTFEGAHVCSIIQGNSDSPTANPKMRQRYRRKVLSCPLTGARKCT